MTTGKETTAYLLLVFFSMGPLAAQTLSTIRGTVTDPTGAVVVGAQVSVKEVRTNVKVRTVTSDNNGNYEAPDVMPGLYEIRAEMAGFKAYVAENIILEGAQIRRVDIILQLGGVAEQVTVEAGAALITTDSGQISSDLKRVMYDQTPMVRNYYPHSLLSTLAGVESQASSWDLRINGQPPAQAALGMDGMTNDGTVNLINRMDFSEITVTGVNNTADQARVANYNMISKRGANQFHGEAWYTHFNSALNARQFFDPVKPAEKEHRAQVAVSGPIIRNRTFFYASYFYLKLPAGFFYQLNAPTLRMRQGDFSQFSTPVVDPATKERFPNNLIPASLINPTSQRIQDGFIPKPNMGGPDTLVNNFGFLHPFPNDLFEARYPQARIDHNFSEKNSIFGRYIRRYTPYVLARSFPGFTWTRYRWHTGWVVTDTHVFSPALVNTFRYGLKYDYIEDGKETAGVTPLRADTAIQQMGIQGVNQAGYKTQGSPAINIVGITGLSTQGGGVVADDKLHSFANSLTWSMGRHVFKFGGELKRQSVFNGSIVDPTFGRFTFNGSLTNQAYADFLLGVPFTSERLNPLINRTRIANEFGAFAMDTFKLTSKLTLDYGLRWDYFSAARYQDGRQYAWDRNSGGVIVSQDASQYVSPLYPKNISVVTGNVLPNSRLTNLRPRLGVAYRLRDRTVIRGGYGIFTEQIGYFARVQGGGPFEIAETYFNAIQNGQPLFSFPNAFPGSLAAATVPSQSISVFPRDTQNGNIHQFNVSVERQIGDVGFRLSYIGSRSRGLNYTLNINKPQQSLIPFTASRRPFPQFVNITDARNDGANNYNSMQFEVQRKAGAFTFDGHYTLQSSVSNFLNTEDPYGPRLWNREAFSARHRLVITTMTELPFGKGRKFLAAAPAAVNQAVEGWKLITVSNFRSSQFFSPSFSGADPSNSNTFGGVPDRVCDGNLPGDKRSVQRWFDASCFVVPPAGRFGNSGVNILERPGLHLHHLSLVKDFTLTERFRLEYNLGISNLFNHPSFDPPQSNISAPRAGEITRILFGADLAIEKTRAREMEMSLRLRW